MADPTLTRAAAWRELGTHYDEMCDVHMRDLFASDPRRFERFSVRASGLLVDYSKHRISARTLELLLELAEQRGLAKMVERLFGGGAVNYTERRAALHMALRHPGDAPFPSAADDVMPEVRRERERVAEFAGRVRDGTWRGFTGARIRSVVNIGIGGSDLGPAMAAHALRPFAERGLEAHFVSNLDSGALSRALAAVEAESTLFIVASKTFSTQETLTNARSARAWLVDRLGSEAAVPRHFVAVSTHAQRVEQFGISTENMFGFWDWVGGRYSVWSAIGLSLVILVGPQRFDEFLAGGAEMDAHFREAEWAHNIPVILALLGIWYRNFFGAATHAILPYDFGLRHLADYLQQLEMESNGKAAEPNGGRVDYDTCPVIWGGLGNNGQHAFFQLLHQGTSLVPSDFLVPLHSQYPLPGHENAFIANAIAQAEALMKGRTAEELASRAGAARRPDALDGHRAVPGNQPTTMVLYERLTPRVLGSLIAMYEHKVFVQSVIWGINPFDQWGVELGKELASLILGELEASARAEDHDVSTAGLIEHVLAARRAARG